MIDQQEEIRKQRVLIERQAQALEMGCRGK
jgi:hypothetical protein